MFKRFLITCDKATTICDKSQYKEATFFELIQLNLHLVFCKFCGLYSKQNTKLSEICKQKTLDSKQKSQCLSTKEKELLKQQLKEINSN